MKNKMIIIPAIDLKNGKCVRLLQGDPNKETVYSDNPIAMAKTFEEAGAELIHIVDLDGAFTGEPVNIDIVKNIANSVTIPVEIGGGIRKEDTIEEYLKAGIKRIILGTVVLGNEFDRFLSVFKENIIVGVDAKDSMVATHGWKTVSKVNAIDTVEELFEKGAREVIYTDISTDGMLQGPNITIMTQILERCKGLNLIASGGVSSSKDIESLARLSEKGLKGCIVGKAIYDGRINLKECIQNIK